jgi:hypothetical protein
MSALSHPDSVEARAASEVKQPAARRKRAIQPAPHFPAHVLDQRVVAALAVIVSGDAIERFPRFVQVLHRLWW